MNLPFSLKDSGFEWVLEAAACLSSVCIQENVWIPEAKAEFSILNTAKRMGLLWRFSGISHPFNLTPVFS